VEVTKLEYERLNNEAIAVLKDVHESKNEWMSKRAKRFVQAEQIFAQAILSNLESVDISRLSVHEIIYKGPIEENLKLGHSTSFSSRNKNTKSKFYSPQVTSRKTMQKKKKPPPSHRPTSGAKSVSAISKKKSSDTSDSSLNSDATNLARSLANQNQSTTFEKKKSEPPSSRPKKSEPPSSRPKKSEPPLISLPPPQSSESTFIAPSPKMNVRGAKLGLKEWTKYCTAGYEHVHIKNLSSSWKNGYAFAALISAFRPDLIDYDNLPDDALERLQIAFDAAEKANVTMLLDAEDVIEIADQKCIKTQLSMYQRTLANTPLKGKRGDLM